VGEVPRTVAVDGLIVTGFGEVMSVRFPTDIQSNFGGTQESSDGRADDAHGRRHKLDHPGLQWVATSQPHSNLAGINLEYISTPEQVPETTNFFDIANPLLYCSNTTVTKLIPGSVYPTVLPFTVGKFPSSLQSSLSSVTTILLTLALTLGTVNCRSNVAFPAFIKSTLHLPLSPLKLATALT
jgi:hypothetical protein